MKKGFVLLLCFVFAFVFIGCGTKDIDVTLQQNVPQTAELIDSHSTYIFDTSVQSDDALMVTGATNTNLLPVTIGDVPEQVDDKLYGYIGKYDSNQQVEWLQYISPENSGRGLCIGTNKQNQICVLHTEKTNSNVDKSDYCLFLSLYSSQGDRINKQMISIYKTQNKEVFAYNPTKEHFYLIVSPENLKTMSSSSNSNASITDTFTSEKPPKNKLADSVEYELVCLNIKGDILWQKELTSSDDYPLSIKMNVSCDGSRLYAVTSISNDAETLSRVFQGSTPDSFEKIKVQAHCFSDNGTSLWLKDIDNDSLGLCESVTDDVEGNVYCMGLNDSELAMQNEQADVKDNNIPYYLFITKLDSEGEEILSTSCSIPISWYPERATWEIRYGKVQNSTYIIGTLESFRLGEKNLFVGKLTKDLEAFNWSSSYFDKKAQSLVDINCNSVKFGSDGNIILAGRLFFDTGEINDESVNAPTGFLLSTDYFEDLPISLHTTTDVNPSYILYIQPDGQPKSFTFFGGGS